MRNVGVQGLATSESLTKTIQFGKRIEGNTSSKDTEINRHMNDRRTQICGFLTKVGSFGTTVPPQNRDSFGQEFQSSKKSQNMSEKPANSKLSSLFKDKGSHGEKRPASEMSNSTVENVDTEGEYGNLKNKNGLMNRNS